MLAKLRTRTSRGTNSSADDRKTALRLSISAPTDFKHEGSGISASISTGIDSSSSSVVSRSTSDGLRTPPSIRRAPPKSADRGRAQQMDGVARQKLRESISGPLNAMHKPILQSNPGQTNIEMAAPGYRPPSIAIHTATLEEACVQRSLSSSISSTILNSASQPLAESMQGYMSIVVDEKEDTMEWEQHWFKIERNWSCLIGYSSPSCDEVTASISLRGFIHTRLGQSTCMRDVNGETVVAIQTCLGTRLVLCPSEHKASSWLQYITDVGLRVQSAPIVTRPSLPPPPPPPITNVQTKTDESTKETQSVVEEENEEDEFETMCLAQGLLQDASKGRKARSSFI